MLRNAKSLMGYTIETTDGETGKVCDILLNERTGKIKHLVLKLGLWTLGREILIPPKDLARPNDALRHVRVSAPREQLFRYPDIEDDMPVSMQQKMRIHDFYRWDASAYWGDIHPWLPLNLPVTAMEKKQMRNIEKHWDRHLHSTKEILHYHVRTSSEDIGQLQDILIDDSRWKIEFLVIKSSDGPVKQASIVASRWIKEINWAKRNVLIDISQNGVVQNPVTQLMSASGMKCLTE
jgi:sporulation protein YlmC with PRC-barrel domain